LGGGRGRHARDLLSDVALESPFARAVTVRRGWSPV
jgi:hypothetical protein